MVEASPTTAAYERFARPLLARLLQLDQARRLERVLATEQVAHHVVAVARAHRPPLRVASQRVLERVRPHQAVEVVVGADPVCRGLALRDAAS
jgi:hypothetical protein